LFAHCFFLGGDWKGYRKHAVEAGINAACERILCGDVKCRFVIDCTRLVQ